MSDSGMGEDQQLRRAALERSRTPRWMAGLVGAALGVLVVLLVAGAHVGWVVAALVVLAGLAVLDWRLKRRRGVRALRIVDERSTGAQLGAYALAFLPLWLVSALRPGEMVDAGLRPWVALACGVVVALGGYGYIRWLDAYQIRRQAAGDYGPWDRV